MYVIHNGEEILCITDVKPDGAYTYVEGGSYESISRDYEIAKGQLRKRRDMTSHHNLRVAMVASYGMNCGLATYTQYLCEELKKLVSDVRVFTEVGSDSNDAIACWDRSGKDYSLLLECIREYDPDVIYIQHEYGSFSNGGQWNTLVGHLNAQYRTIVVLHSVYDHFDKLIFEAPCKEIIVHSQSGKELLTNRGVDHCKIHHIPHGCIDPIKLDGEVKFSIMKNKYVLFQYGFGFEYKGWSNAINIVDELRKVFPDILYIGVFNISEFSKDFSRAYFLRLMSRVRELGLEKHFVIIEGFRSEEILLSYMKQASVNIFPYWNHHEWLVHGASGAVRLALASGTPTVVGDVPFFSEFKGHIPVCDTMSDYVGEISKLLTNNDYRESVIESTNKFIDDRTWHKTALRYLEIL